MKEELISVETLLFYYLDKCQFLFFPSQWNPFFLDYSKNEIFVLLFIYRRGYVNMTEIAEYMKIPLNTATGIVSRLEKKEIVKRERNSFDKRIVTISLTELGKEFLVSEIEQFSYYMQKIMDGLTEEEKQILIKIVDKTFSIFNNEKEKQEQKKKRKIKRIPIE